MCEGAKLAHLKPTKEYLRLFLATSPYLGYESEDDLGSESRPHIACLSEGRSVYTLFSLLVAKLFLIVPRSLALCALAHDRNISPLAWLSPWTPLDVTRLQNIHHEAPTRASRMISTANLVINMNRTLQAEQDDQACLAIVYLRLSAFAFSEPC